MRDVALGETNAPDIEAVREVDGAISTTRAVNYLGAATADVEDAHMGALSDRVDAAERAGEGEASLFVAGDRPRLDAELRLHVGANRLAAARVAHRARPDDVDARRARRLDHGGVIVERRVRARDRLRRELSRLVDALAKPGDGRPLFHGDELPRAGPLRDEKQHRVRPNVDRCDAHVLQKHGRHQTKDLDHPRRARGPSRCWRFAPASQNEPALRPRRQHRARGSKGQSPRT